VVLISNESETYNKWNFYNMPTTTENGEKKLSYGGTISKRLTGKSIEKKDQVYQMYLNYNFIGPAPLAEMVQEQEIKAFNEILPLGFKAQKPESPYFFWDKSDKKQYWLLLLIIAIIWFITSILFESLLKPLAVIVLIPISFIGVFLTFYLFGFNFDQGGFASFILLCGLVVNAAIYIINDMNNLVSRKGKDETIQTYVKAFNQKIIPIMLTILSTVLGLIPFIWGGQKEVFWFAFAAGASGGLIFSLVAIIVFLPLFLKLKIK
jgi:multidrug efflux pump subunit AcrB